MLADGKVEFDQSYYKSTIIDRPDLYTDKLMELLKVNPKKIKSNNIDWKKAIAFAMQFCAEEIAIHLIKEISKKIKSKNLVSATYNSLMKAISIIKSGIHPKNTLKNAIVTGP